MPTAEFGTNTGRQGVFNPRDPRQRSQAIQRLAVLSSQYGDKLDPRFTGDTGLARGDADGYSTMLNARTEAGNIDNILGGRAPMTTRMGGESTTRTIPTAQNRDMTADADGSFARQNAAGYGSGAAVAGERERDEANRLLAGNVASKARIEGQDVLGRSRAMVARGDALNNELYDVNEQGPKVQAGQNRIATLAGNAARDEWQKNFENQEPARRYADQQFQTRYVEPARIRAAGQVDTADVTGRSRVDAAEATAGGRVEGSRLDALGRAAQGYIKEGQLPAAQMEMDQVDPLDEIQQAIIEMKRSQPGLAPDKYLYMLGDSLTPEEKAHAVRLLGGSA